MNIKVISLFLFFFIIGSLGFVVHSFAASTFPVKALGNCRDAQECFYYCEIPSNMAACSVYAQSNIFTKVLGESTTVDSSNSPTNTPRFTFPIAALGNCNSAQECSSYCAQSANRTTCMQYFSQRNTTQPSPSTDGHATSRPTQINPQYLLDASKILGCSTYPSCLEFCKQPTNHQACESFGASERAKGVYPVVTSVPPVTTSLMSTIDCSKAENKERCGSFTNLCKSFCGRNPNTCSVTSLSSQP